MVAFTTEDCLSGNYTDCSVVTSVLKPVSIEEYFEDYYNMVGDCRRVMDVADDWSRDIEVLNADPCEWCFVTSENKYDFRLYFDLWDL